MVEETEDGEEPWLGEGDPSPEVATLSLRRPSSRYQMHPSPSVCTKKPTHAASELSMGEWAGGGGGQLGDKPTLFLKHSSRLGFRCSDLERWQMDPNWLLSRPGWGEARQQGFEGTSGW